ncbi:MAG: hypothetical protein V4642_12965 [Bacteroidota bacterium]
MKTNAFFKTAALAAIFIAANSFTALAQMGTNVLLQGIAIDGKTKSPVEIRYEINNSSSGQRIRGKSLNDGSFQQVLKPGETYTISFTGKNIYRAPEAIALRPSEKYYEEKRTFEIIKLTPGHQLAAISLFKTGTAEMEPEATAVLKTILSGVKNEDIPSVVISVANDPVVKGAKAPKPVKGAKKSKKAPVVNIQKDRVAALTEFVGAMGEYVSNKVSIIAEKGKMATNVSIKTGK